MNAPYQPSMSFSAKVSRKLLPMRARRHIRIAPNRPIVSFTFDDFPRSALYEGADMLAKHNWQATFYVAAGLAGVRNHHGQSFTDTDLKHLQTKGHEIAGHTYSHLDCGQSDEQQLLAEIEQNKSALREMGAKKPIEHFAWPYGTTNTANKTLLAKHFKSMRGVTPGVNRGRADLNCLKSTPLYSGAKLDYATNLIEGLEKRPGWLILFTHDVRETPSKWGLTPAEFLGIIDAVKTSGASVLPVGKALERVEAAHG